MGDFALLVFSDETEAYDEKLSKYFSSKINYILKKYKVVIEVEKTVLYDDLNMFLLKLPYKTNELMYFSKGKFSKLNRIISEICFENNIRTCYLPQIVPESHMLTVCSKTSFKGELVFKSLLIDILDEVYYDRGIKIADLDITIMHEGDYRELFLTIMMLAPHVKYITVFTDSKEAIKKELDEIFYDTGLAIGVTNECKNSLKSADIIVNLGKPKKLIFNYKIKPKALIINYGGTDAVKFESEGIVINGIEISVPGDIQSKMDKNVYKYFSRLEMAETILIHRLGFEDKIIARSIELSTLKKISKAFKKDGYKVEGFIGRHSTVKALEMSV